MKGLLGLAADFLDRASNPAFGPEVNEAYGLRLGELLEHDAALGDELTHLALEGGDADLLTTSGWIRFLDFLRSNGARPPDAVLTVLYDRARGTWLRLKLVEAIVTMPALNLRMQDRPSEPYPIGAYPDRWLAARLEATVTGRTAPGTLSQEDRYRVAVDLLLILLQLGTPAAVEAARSLLAHRWEAGERLRADVIGLLERLPNGETRQMWLNLLSLQGRG